MGIFAKTGSPFWWCLLEGHGRRRESTGIRRDASTKEMRETLRLQAEEYYHARMVQLARERVGLPIQSSVTFKEWAAWYETHHLAKHRGAVRERVMLGHLLEHFGGLTLSEIRKARWQEYETKRLKTVAPNTVARELGLMKTMLVAAVGEHLEVSPLAHVKRKTQRLPAKRTLTKDDEERLLEQLAADVDDHRRGAVGNWKPDRAPAAVQRERLARAELRDMYLVAVGTLLRQMNVALLQGRDVHADRVTVQTKTGPHALSLAGPTRLQTRAAVVLRRRAPKKPTGFFFPIWGARFRDSQPAANKLFLQTFRRACTRAGIPWGLRHNGVVWHTATRASGATRMMREHGIDVRTVQLLGGWSSLDQMAQYLGVDLAAASQVNARKRRAV